MGAEGDPGAGVQGADPCVHHSSPRAAAAPLPALSACAAAWLPRSAIPAQPWAPPAARGAQGGWMRKPPGGAGQGSL